MANVIETQLISRDQASKAIHDITKALQSLGAASAQAGKKAGKASGGFMKMFGAMTVAQLAAGLITSALRKLVRGFVEVMRYTGRVDEMRIVLQQVGKTAGYSAATMEYFTQKMKGLGIETDIAQAGLVRMIQAQFKLTDALKVARVAQDAAVVSGKNSSEALETMIHGIVTLRPIVLRQLGIMLNLEEEYKRVARETNRAVESFSQQEKQQIALNAALKEGAKLQGTYEAAMESASKQLRSTPRYTKEMMEQMTKLAQPMFKEFVLGLNDAIKDLTNWMKNHQQELADFGTGLAMLTRGAFKLAGAMETVLYWLRLSPRAWAEMARGWRQANQAMSDMWRWLTGTSSATIEAEHRMRAYKKVLDENRESINSLLKAEDLNLRAEILNLQHDYKKGLIDEIEFKKKLETLTEKLAMSEVALAEAKKQARIAEEQRQLALEKMRKKLSKEIQRLSMKDADFAKQSYEKQAEEYMKLIGKTEEGAQDREMVEKWLHLRLQALEEKTADRRKSIVDEMNKEIIRITKGAAAENKLILQQKVRDAQAAGVEETLIAKYQAEKLAEIERGMPKRSEFEVQLEAEVATTDPMAELQQEHLERRESIKQHYEDLLEDAKQFEDAKEQIARVGAASERALQAEQAAYIRAQQEMQIEQRLQSMQYLQSGLEAIYNAGLAKNKAVFYAMKALAISEAIIQTNLAANKAVGQTGIFGLPMSAFIYAQGMMRVAAIAAQQPGYAEGGVVYPAGSGGRSVTVAEKGPEAIVPLSGGRAIPVEMQGAPNGNVMHVNIQAIDTQTGIDFLLKNKSTIGNAMMDASADNHPVRRA